MKDRKKGFELLAKALELLDWQFATLKDESEKPNGMFIGNETFFEKLESDDT